MTLSWVMAGPSASDDCCSDCDSYLTPAPFLARCSDYDGRTALHLAACEGHQGVVSVLLEQASVNINATDRGHRTALQEAIAHRQVCYSVVRRRCRRPSRTDRCGCAALAGGSEAITSGLLRHRSDADADAPGRKQPQRNQNATQPKTVGSWPV